MGLSKTRYHLGLSRNDTQDEKMNVRACDQLVLNGRIQFGIEDRLKYDSRDVIQFAFKRNVTINLSFYIQKIIVMKSF